MIVDRTWTFSDSQSRIRLSYLILRSKAGAKLQGLRDRMASITNESLIPGRENPMIIPYPPDVIPSGCPDQDESEEDEDDE